MQKLTTNKLIRYILLIIISLLAIFPLIWMVLNALKTGQEISENHIFPVIPQWQNFVETFDLAPFGKYMWNSFFTASIIVLLQIILSSMLAYALVFLEFRLRNVLFFIVLATYMLPSATTYVPSYIILGKLDLLDTFVGLILSCTVNVSMIFLLRQNFKRVPKEFIEAARVSGANEWQIYYKVVLPYCKSALFTTGILSFIANYNSYLWPTLILNSEEKMLISMGVNRFYTMQGSFASKWPLIMAATAISIIPMIIIYVVFQKYLLSGINKSNEGLKG